MLENMTLNNSPQKENPHIHRNESHKIYGDGVKKIEKEKKQLIMELWNLMRSKDMMMDYINIITSLHDRIFVEDPNITQEHLMHHILASSTIPENKEFIIYDEYDALAEEGLLILIDIFKNSGNLVEAQEILDQNEEKAHINGGVEQLVQDVNLKKLQDLLDKINAIKSDKEKAQPALQ